MDEGVSDGRSSYLSATADETLIGGERQYVHTHCKTTQDEQSSTSLRYPNKYRRWQQIFIRNEELRVD